MAASGIRADPRFNAACVDICDRVLALYGEYPGRLEQLADQGQFHMIALAYLLDPHITAAAVLKLLPEGIVGRNRVPDYLASLERRRVLTTVPDEEDRRRRTRRLDPEFREIIGRWIDMLIMPALPFAGLPPLPPPTRDIRLRWVFGFEKAMLSGANFARQGPRVDRLMSLRHGFLLFFALLRRARVPSCDLPPFSIRATALRYQVPRSQVTTLLAIARAESMVIDGDNGLQLTPDFIDEAAQWQSLHLAIAAHCLQTAADFK